MGSNWPSQSKKMKVQTVHCKEEDSRMVSVFVVVAYLF